MRAFVGIVAVFVVAGLAAAVSASNALPSHYILSVTASGDEGTPNTMVKRRTSSVRVIAAQHAQLQFDPTNASVVYNSAPYPHYEDTLWGCYDSKRDRYLLLTEELEINFYDARSLQQLSSLSIYAIDIQARRPRRRFGPCA
jgi:hypothetical protein